MIPHVEIITKRCGGSILHSTVRPATEAEITEAHEKYKATGHCDHRIVVDERGWMCDIRRCHTCGTGLGTV